MKRVAILTSCITESIGRLPGVATTDWADRAAASVARVLSRGSASVLVGCLDARGFLVQVELAGAGRSDDLWPAEGHPAIAGNLLDADPEAAAAPDGLDDLRRSFRLGEWVGWSLGPITPQTLATTTASLAGLRRTESPVWKRWSRGSGPEVGEIVAGVAAVPGSRESRVVLVEIACPSHTDGEQAAMEASMASAVLEAVLPMLASKVASAFLTADRSQWLTPREEEVLWHLLAGEKVPDIAAALGRSVYTVHDHVKSLHRKLGASNRGELVSRALGHIGPRTPTRQGNSTEPPQSIRSAGTGKPTRL